MTRGCCAHRLRRYAQRSAYCLGLSHKSRGNADTNLSRVDHRLSHVTEDSLTPLGVWALTEHNSFHLYCEKTSS